MKKVFLIVVIIISFGGKVFAQFDFSPIFDPNSANMVLQSQMRYIQAKREMDQRVMSLRQQIQPLRDEMRIYYNNGEYKQAIDVYFKALDCLYYKYDHLAVEDMALLAGECAEKLGNISAAIEIYKNGGQQDMTNFTPQLFRISNSLLDDADNLIGKKFTSTARDKIRLAQTTETNPSRCILLMGKSYEIDGDYTNAMSYYKIAKKNKYFGADEAINQLKEKIKIEKKENKS